MYKPGYLPSSTGRITGNGNCVTALFSALVLIDINTQGCLEEESNMSVIYTLMHGRSVHQ